MSPAITGLLGIDEVCKSCMAKLDTAALKCSKCQHYIHMSCYGLPEYQMVRFAVSQAQYLCMSCCKTDTGDQKYEEEVKSIKELLDREKLLITPPESDSDKQSDLPEKLDQVIPFVALISNTHAVETAQQECQGTSQTVQGASTTINNTDPTKLDKVCNHYINRSCKFGPKGEKCRFSHPKICKFFAKFGDRKGGGCKKGERCSFYHPKLCWQTARGFQCNRKNCHFLHPFGLKAKPRDYDDEEGLRQPSNDENVNVQPTYSKMLRSSQPIGKDKAQTGRTVLKSNSHQIEQRQVENSNSNFLEIQEKLHEDPVTNNQDYASTTDRVDEGQQCNQGSNGPGTSDHLPTKMVEASDYGI